MFSLRQLEAVAAIADEGSLQAAAVKLSISRATLSHLLNELEKAVATSLFVRTPYGTKLTPAGEDFRARADQVLAEAEALRHKVVHGHLGDRAELRVQVSATLPHFVSALAAMLMEHQYPELRPTVSIVGDPTAELSENVHLRIQVGPNIPKGPFRTVVIHRDPVYLCASDEYIQLHGIPRTLEELRRHRLLTWTAMEGEGEWLPLLAGGSFEVVPALRSSDSEMLRELAARNGGIAFVPRPLSDFGLPFPPLQEVLTDTVGTVVHIRAVFPAHLATTRLTRISIELGKQISRMVNSGELVWDAEP